MIPVFKGRPVGKLALLTVLGILGIALSVRGAKADGLDKFTGYTRPGALNELPVPAEGVRPAGLDPERTGLGTTVYFRVFDLSEGMEGDPWNTGIKNFANTFIPGKDSTGNHPSRKLDTSARYLYLYQTINDSKRESNVKMTTIRLVVPPHLITSWGHFSSKGENVPLRGVGFSAVVTNPSPDHPEFKNHIRPASTDNPAADRTVRYERHAPAHIAEKGYGVMQIGLGNIRHVALDDNGLGEDIGREPEAVVLVNAATFDGPPRHRPGLDGLYGAGLFDVGQYGPDMGGFGGFGFPGFGGFSYPFVSRVFPGPMPFYGPGYSPCAPLAPLPVVPVGPGVGPDVAPAAYEADQARLEEELNRSPAIRAYWLDSPLKPGERATIFGFTSNYPPVYEDVRVRGNPRFAIGLVALAPDIANASLTGAGEVPTPVAFEQPVTGAFGSTVGFLGGLPPTGNLGGPGGGGIGAAGGLPGFGGTLGGGTTNGGGVPGGGTGGGTGNGTGNNTGTGTGNNNGTGTGNGTGNTAPVNIVNNNTNSQQQTQQQQQKQKQKQKQQQTQENENTTPPSNVIPEPASVLTILLGLPVAFFVVRRGLKGKTPTERAMAV